MGRHIKILGRGDADRLGSADQVEAFLIELVGRIGMRRLGEPHLYSVDLEIEKLGVEPFEDEGGITGVVVLSTSHCAIHTWPLRASADNEMFVLDVYSCRDFDPGLPGSLLERRFGAHGLVIAEICVGYRSGLRVDYRGLSDTVGSAGGAMDSGS